MTVLSSSIDAELKASLGGTQDLDVLEEFVSRYWESWTDSGQRMREYVRCDLRRAIRAPAPSGPAAPAGRAH